MWVNETLVEKEYAEARDTVRGLLARVYDQNYRSYDELYGRSNDTAADLLDGDGDIEFPPLNTAGSSKPLPYVPPTEFDPESGTFTGLEPPLA